MKSYNKSKHFFHHLLYIPGAVLSIWIVLYKLILHNWSTKWRLTIPMYQMRRLRHREAKWLLQGHAASKWQNLNLLPDSLPWKHSKPLLTSTEEIWELGLSWATFWDFPCHMLSCTHSSMVGQPPCVKSDSFGLSSVIGKPLRIGAHHDGEVALCSTNSLSHWPLSELFPGWIIYFLNYTVKVWTDPFLTYHRGPPLTIFISILLSERRLCFNKLASIPVWRCPSNETVKKLVLF